MRNWISSKQFITAICMLGLGATLGPFTEQYQNDYKAVPLDYETATPVQAIRAKGATTATAASAKEQRRPDISDPKLTLAELTGADSSFSNMAAYLYDFLSEKDSSQAAQIYQIYQQSAEINHIQMNFKNSAGQPANGLSNTKEILSMASLLYDYGILNTREELEQYVSQLWDGSHGFTSSVSAVYFCEGCQYADGRPLETASPAEATDGVPAASGSEDTAEAAAVTETLETAPMDSTSASQPENAAETEYGPHLAILASASEAASESPSGSSEVISNEIICPGHVDISISVTVSDLTEPGGLMSQDTWGNDPANQSVDGWPGWTEETIEYVRSLADQDWYQDYQLEAEAMVVRNPLTTEEIQLYMNLLPNDTSTVRQNLVRYALSSVGKVPYYWGGKPSRGGYEGNNFGTVISPDEDGRFLKGLDCSGWISWVYLSVTGQRPAGESTSTLISCGTPISAQELQPGDICIRTGHNAHVVMFLCWQADGSMLCINETSGNINNVEVGSGAANWAYYRRLLP